MTLGTWAAVMAIVVGLLVIPRLIRGRKVSSSIVKEKINAGALIVDVRTPDEFRSGAYPGAVNIPLSELGNRHREIPREKPVVVYCVSGVRSASAARLLKQAGVAEVLNAGGLKDMPP